MSLLTLKDLHDFYSKRGSDVHFARSDTTETVFVHVPATLSFEDGADVAKLGLTPVSLKVCHTGQNMNRSVISENTMTNALPSIFNRPILGYIYEDEDGTKHFDTHNTHEDENGDCVYDEQPVGIIPESCDAHLEYDKDQDKTYVVAGGYLFNRYSDAASILFLKGTCSVSAELQILDFSYSSSDDLLTINEFIFSGVTILGEHEDTGEKVIPGMTGAEITIENFNAKNNSVMPDNTEFINELKRLNENFSALNILLNKEGGKTVVNKFDELLAKYNVTADAIDFEVDGLSDDELEKAFADKFDAAVSDSEPSTDGEQADDTPKTFEVIHTFELSHDNIKWSIYAKLADVDRANQYRTCFDVVSVFDEYFVYKDYNDENRCALYAQKYHATDTNVEFDGEPYQVFAEYLTESERDAVDEMRAAYPGLVEFKANADAEKLHAMREEVLNAEAYATLAGDDDFADLRSRMDEYSVDELQTKADLIFAKHVKSVGTFSLNTEQKPANVQNVHRFDTNEGSKDNQSPYPGLFLDNEK